jgi:hypothetical protein
VASRAGKCVHHGSLGFFEALAQGLIDYAVEAFTAPQGAAITAELPPALSHIWVWFCDLSRSWTSYGHGLNPISFSEIDAWARVMQTNPTPWEIGLIRRIDAAVLKKLMETPGKNPGEASVRDTAAVQSVFAGLKARAAEVFGK